MLVSGHVRFVLIFFSFHRSTKLRDLRFEDLTPNELISYHHESDLLPIIISNCNYTYSKNDCATLEYDFDSIQAAITDQIIQGKPIINVDVLQSVDKHTFLFLIIWLIQLGRFGQIALQLICILNDSLWLYSQNIDQNRRVIILFWTHLSSNLRWAILIACRPSVSPSVRLPVRL